MRKAIALLALSLFLGAAITSGSMAQTPDADAAVDAKALYAAKCAGCHGADGSKGVKGNSYGSVANALNGYKAKAYGGAKKQIMEVRAAQLSNAEIRALAGFVSGL